MWLAMFISGFGCFVTGLLLVLHSSGESLEWTTLAASGFSIPVGFALVGFGATLYPEERDKR